MNRCLQKQYEWVNFKKFKLQTRSTRIFDSIPVDSLPTIPEQVALSQIVIVPPPLADAKEAVYSFALSLRDSIINHGKTLEELARRMDKIILHQEEVYYQ